MAHKESEDKKNHAQQTADTIEEQDAATAQTDKVSDEQAYTEDERDATTSDKKNQLEQEVADSKDKYLRLYAEFENFRRRTAKERLDLTKTANEKLLSDLLPVVDDFGRSVRSFKESENTDPVYAGIKLVHNKLTKVLEQQGLKSMEAKQGDTFDAEYHEAITQIPAPDESLKGKIVDVIEQGYFLGEKVLRYAKVVTGA